MTTGFGDGGIDGPGFGIAISGDDKVWTTSLTGRNISVFDRKTGEPLSPKDGFNFGGQLGQMRGIIVTPSGDVWALDNGKSQIVYTCPRATPRKATFSAAQWTANPWMAPSNSRRPSIWPFISRIGFGSPTAAPTP